MMHAMRTRHATASPSKKESSFNERGSEKRRYGQKNKAEVIKVDI